MSGFRFFISCLLLFSFAPADEKMHAYVADPLTQEISLYWKNDQGEILGNAKALEAYLKTRNKKLIFAMNAGMYKEDRSAQGLFIDKGREIVPIDRSKGGNGNFYMKPNGIFYITKAKKAGVCRTADFSPENVQYATQSGPMLLINGALHPAFQKGSANLHIRNGVGILPDGKILFAISKTTINFYDLAMFFKNAGCKNALYLDGFVSRMYLPEKNILERDGSFGVMIGIAE